MISPPRREARAPGWHAERFLRPADDAAVGLRSPKDWVCSETRLLAVNGVCFPKSHPRPPRRRFLTLAATWVR